MPDMGLTDLDRWQQGVPFDVFDEIRNAGAVQLHPNAEGRDFWSVVGHAELVEVSRDGTRFAASPNNSIRDSFEVGHEPTVTQAMMHMLNGRAHTRLRGLVSKAFTPKVISELETNTRELARTIVDRAAAQEQFDFVTEVSAAMPLTVICDLLGIPEEDRPRILDWTNRMMGGDDPEYSTSIEAVIAAAGEFAEYAMTLAARRRAEPGDDLTSHLLLAEVDGERLTDLEYQAFFQLLSAAGNETTRNLISHGMLALIEHPDQRKLLLDDPESLPLAIEEMLRWGSPVAHFARDVIEDTELGGQQLRKGDKVVLWYGAANRDPKVFHDPQVFDITRDPNPHVAFGGRGPHFCLGASLARMEVRVLFEELLTRLPDLELAGAPERMRSNMFNSIKHLPVRRG